MACKKTPIEFAFFSNNISLKFWLILSWALCFGPISAQVAPTGGGSAHLEHSECLLDTERALVQSQVEENVSELRQKGLLVEPVSEAIVYFIWPLRMKPGLTDPSYYGISNFVDEDGGSGLLDYNCGNNTYNGHKGTDVFLWPFPWAKMDNDEVEVIAAAAGTIVAKYDGNFDRQCNWVNGAQGNGIVLQHADGSRSWYWHFKKSTITSKGVGSSVAAGEFLGVVGSSGISTGPHLHFEVYNSANQLIDPWNGPCNSLGGQSWWSNQNPYDDPKVNRLATHTAAPIMPNCGADVLNLSNEFQPGSTVYFAAYYRDQSVNSVSSYAIRRPDGTTWQTWNHTPPNSHNASWWYWDFTLPTTAATGTWTFQVTFNGQTTVHNFNVQGACGTPSSNQISVTNVAANSAQLNCLATNGVQAYDWRFRPIGNASWTDLPLTTPSFYSLPNLQTNTTYEYQVSVQCSNGIWSNWSSSGQFTTLSTCNTPGNLSASSGSQSVTFNWSPVAGALSYTLEVRPAGASHWNQRVTTSSNSHTFFYLDNNNISSTTGLGSNTPYEWRVRTNCSNASTSDWTTASTFTTPSASCNSPLPSDLEIISLSATSATVRCNRPGFRYQFRKALLSGGDASFQTNQSSNNTRTFSGLQPCQVYQVQCRIRCVSGGPTSYYSASLFFTTQGCACNAPSSLSTANITNTSAILNWQAVSGAQNYTLQLRTLPNGTFNDIPGGPFTGTSRTITGLTAGISYEWRIRTNCTNGQQSAWSAGISFTTVGASCSTPIGLTTTDITATSARFNWQTVNGALSYSLQVLINNNWADVNGGPFTGTNVNVTGLSANTNYQWRIRTNCTNGQQSAWSAGISFTTAGAICSTPIGLTTTDITATSARFNWQTVNGALSYSLQVLINNNWADVNGGPFTGTNVNVTGLSANTNYQWRIRTNCTNGQQSAWSAGISFTTAGATCSTPIGLTTTNITATSARFNWQTVNGALSYSLQILINNNWVDVNGGPFTGTNVNVTGLSANTNYQWRIRTNCTNGQQSAWSAGVIFTTIGGGCGTPTGLFITSVTQVKATLNWGGVSGATNYTVQFFVNNSWYSLSPVTGTSVNVYGLYANSSYQWRVFATCSNGQQGAPSASVTFNTESAPNCNIGTQYPSIPLTPTTSWQYQTEMWGGEYCVVNVQAGEVYTFSYCSADGAAIAFDGELSIRTLNNQLIMYADDVCDIQPRLVWQAGFTGQIRVLLTRYSCSTQNTNSTMAYQIGGNPFGGGHSADNLTATEIIYLNVPPSPRDTELAISNTERQDSTVFAGSLGSKRTTLETFLPISALEVQVSPNPASGLTTVTALLNDADVDIADAVVNLLDLNGSIRRQTQEVKVVGQGLQATLDLSDLPNGMYLVQVRANGHTEYKQLVVIR